MHLVFGNFQILLIILMWTLTGSEHFSGKMKKKINIYLGLYDFSIFDDFYRKLSKLTVSKMNHFQNISKS